MNTKRVKGQAQKIKHKIKDIKGVYYSNVHPNFGGVGDNYTVRIAHEYNDTKTLQNTIKKLEKKGLNVFGMIYLYSHNSRTQTMGVSIKT